MFGWSPWASLGDLTCLLSVNSSVRRKKAANSPLYPKAVRVGNLATRAGRLIKQKSKSSFGPRTKDIERMQRRAARDMLFARTEGIKNDTTACQLVVAKELARGGTVEEALQTGRSLSRAAVRRQQETARENALVIASWEDTQGAELVREASATLPALSGPTFSPMPYAFGKALVLAPPSDDDVLNAVAWMQANGNKTKLGKTLDRAFDQATAFVSEKEARPYPDIGEEAISACNKAGVCLCTGDGITLNLIVNRFMNLLRVRCPFISTERQMLAAGRIVAHIHGGGEAGPPL